MYQIGTFIGAALAMAMFTWIFGLFAFKSLAPEARAIVITGIVYFGAAVVFGFGEPSPGAPFVFSGFVYYLPGAIIASYLCLRRYRKLWRDSDVDPDVFT